jgi:hypothetical protein
LFWELVEGGLGSFFADVARGQLGSVSCRDGFAGALRVTIPPWPTERHTAEENVPLRGVDKRTLKESMYLYNVKTDESGELSTAGGWGIVCLFTGCSSNPLRALARPLEAAKSLRLKNKQFRTDLAKRFAEDIEKLESAGVHVNASAMETA